MSLRVGMPNLGHTMESGTLAEWSVAVGDEVASGQVIGAVETEKATFDIEAPGDGVVLAIFVEAGTDVPVGTVLAVVGNADEAVEEADMPASPAKPEAAATAEAAVPADLAPGRRVLASPAARRTAEELGVDLGTVEGTGEDGMVTKEDVEDAASRSAASPSPASKMRKTIAEATSRAWAEIPHVPLTSHADLDAAIAPARVTAAVVRASALALRRHPALNGWWTGEVLEPSGAANVGVVVALPDGLATPVIERADEKSVEETAGEIAALAKAARKGTLKGAQTTGASFTVSALGRWGVDSFAPIIAAPQVAILGVGSVRRAPREAGESIRFVNELGLTLVFDHRANDGVAAAELLAEIVRLLESADALEANG